MTPFVILLAALLAVSIWMYNRMVGMRRLTENAWADMDVFLKRRSELVPNLVEAVKGAAAYERATLERVTAARHLALDSPGPTADRAAAESELGRGLSQAVIVAEAYPDLKANQTFLRLQSELTDTERLIASSRQYYNACVRDYNTMIESFPHSLVAAGFGFRAKDFFEIEIPTERSVPEVKNLG